ncbi:MAG TPA: T9SS type A sorting domain-containing protein, partial [Puia sp.]|nr:T9SS type A sorting domain-containing protein [Puia sp.]
GDVWSTNAAQNQVVQCFTQELTVSANIGQVNNLCVVSLPVTLLSFSGRETGNSTVLLSWQTAAEANNKGFAVERKTGAGDFQQVGFVTSQEPDGNSNATLDYQYGENLPSGGEFQYRLAQEDRDGKKQYSAVISIHSDGSAAGKLLVYPNPAPGGHMTVTFDSPDKRDLTISDASGRVIRVIRNITDNTCQISNLRTGIYFLKVTSNAGGGSRLAKLIVQ